jgi:hypothetical protein
MFFFVLLLCAVVPRCEIQSADAAAIRAAVMKSLPLLQRGAESFRERSEGRCISCHHQGLVLQTVALARERGFPIDENLARAEIDRVHGFYVRRQARYLAALEQSAGAAQADPFGNFTVHAGYWLWGLAAEKQAPDEALATTVRLLASKQLDDGRWSFTDTARAPMQAGDFTTTALAVFAVQRYASAGEREQIDRRVRAAAKWLAATAPRTTDDKAFRLLGVHWSAAPATQQQHAAADLLADQRTGGGWGQQENMPPDAYATGLALAALAQSHGLDMHSPEYDEGVNYLLQQQNPDGSWFVKTRAIPTNPYFESGFPHGKSQFISYAATCWATMALTLALDGLPGRE